LMPGIGPILRKMGCPRRYQVSHPEQPVATGR